MKHCSFLVVVLFLLSMSSGEPFNVKTVTRLMQLAQIRARRNRGSELTADSNHSLPIAGNLLGREFTVEQVNQKWVADTTHIDTNTSWIYKTTILDLLSRRIVSWQTSDRIDTKLATEIQFCSVSPSTFELAA